MSPLVFAHRGFSLEAPENTMAAFRLGWQSGASGVECDVHLTADSKIVCIHDYDTGRVSDRKIKIAESDWSEWQPAESFITEATALASSKYAAAAHNQKR